MIEAQFTWAYARFSPQPLCKAARALEFRQVGRMKKSNQSQ